MELFKIFGTIGLNGVSESEKELKDLSNQAEGTSSKIGKAFGIFGKIGKGVLATTTAVGGGAIALVKQVSGAYGQLQQSIGGVETLFGESAQRVIDNANNAYTTAGISANEYMQQVTSFTASLLQSLEGDTEKTADVADMAVRDMADNANKFGTSMESIQNAYQGFSKQNYTMLDNLKLGYGGTKTEMERLLKDAEKISGIKYDITSLSDVYSAIHVIQQELGVTGTTAQEAGATIEGSFNSLGASWQNFLAGLGNPDADMQKLVDNLAKGISGAINNVTPIIDNMVKVLPTVADSIIGAISSMAPTLINTFSELLSKVLDSVVDLLPHVIQPLIDCLMSVAQSIIENLPTIVDAVMQVILGLAKAISESAPTLVPIIVEVIGEIINLIISNIPLIIEVGSQLIMGLAKGLINAIPVLIDMLPQIIESIVETLLSSLPNIVSTGKQLLLALINGIITAIPKLLALTPKIIMSMLKGFIDAVPNMFEAGKNMMNGLWNGLKSIWDSIVGWFTQAIDWIKNLWSNFTDWLSGNFKTPHFTVEGTLNPIKWFDEGLPKIGVEWYAKGGIMTNPTVFGLNPSTGNAMVGGESGAEAIAPISELQSYVSEAVAEQMSGVNDTMNRMYDLLSTLLPQMKDNMDRPIVLDTGAMVSGTVDKIDSSLGDRTSRKLRYGV